MSDSADWTAEGPIGSAAALRRIRRDLHNHPELGFLEYRTAAKLAAALVGLGWDVKAGPEVMREDAMMGRPCVAAIKSAQETAIMQGASPDWIARMPGGQTGLVAALTRGEGPTIAFRFDMDALPVTEATSDDHAPERAGFRSSNHGIMHACGHDGHTAIGLSVAARLAAQRDWRGTIKLIFQPAEEGGRGAMSMVEAGVLDDVDSFFAAHIGCHLPTGEIAANMDGFLFSTKVDVIFKGKAAHAAASPHAGVNALLAGAAATLALHGIAPHADNATRVNVGRMVGGAGRNIVADFCELQLEVRGGSQRTLDYMTARMKAILDGAAVMHGAEVSMDIVGRTAGADSSPRAIRLVANAAKQVAGVHKVVPAWLATGSEDATFMMQRVRNRGGEAAYFVIGSDLTAPHHATHFDIDERALLHGLEVFTRIAANLLNGGMGPTAGTRE